MCLDMSLKSVQCFDFTDMCGKEKECKNETGFWTTNIELKILILMFLEECT